MKAKISILLLMIASCVAWAQTPKPAAKPAAGGGQQAAKASPMRPKPAAAKPVTAKPEAAKPEVAKAAKAAPLRAGVGKRDPFVSPIVKATGNVACPSGKKCLVIDEVALRGVVHGPMGRIAVVENAARKAYFLRENDPVFNGYVVRITGDSIVFKENVVDRFGRTNQRDVIKRVVAPAV